jgi:hypothetical protein
MMFDKKKMKNHQGIILIGRIQMAMKNQHATVLAMSNMMLVTIHLIGR